MVKGQRTLELEKKIRNYRDEGHSVYETAELCGVAKPTVYRYLKTMAEEAGVSYSDFLDQPHCGLTVRKTNPKKPSPKPGSKHTKNKEGEQMAKGKNNQKKLTAKQKKAKKGNAGSASAQTTQKTEAPARILPDAPITTLQTYNIRMAIKKGISPADLCEKYQCRLEDFDRRVRTLFTNEKDAEKILNWLERSAEQVHGRKRATREALRKGEGLLKAIEVGQEVRIGDKNSETRKTEENESESGQPMTKRDELYWKRSELKNKISNSEDYENSLVAERQRVMEEIPLSGVIIKEAAEKRRVLVAALEENERIYQEAIDARQGAIEVASNIGDQIDTVKQLREQQEAELEIVEEEIAVEETVAIYVYDTGEIVAENKYFAVEIDDDGCDKCYNMLFHRRACGKIIADDIWILARAMQVFKHLSRRYHCIIEFDNPALAVAFEELTQ